MPGGVTTRTVERDWVKARHFFCRTSSQSTISLLVRFAATAATAATSSATGCTDTDSDRGGIVRLVWIDDIATHRRCVGNCVFPLEEYCHGDFGYFVSLARHAAQIPCDGACLSFGRRGKGSLVALR